MDLFLLAQAIYQQHFREFEQMRPYHQPKATLDLPLFRNRLRPVEMLLIAYAVALWRG